MRIPHTHQLRINAERDYTGRVHGVAANTPNRTHVAHAGWVGVTTYVDTHGNLRTKSEVYVAASGITTGNTVLPLTVDK